MLSKAAGHELQLDAVRSARTFWLHVNLRIFQVRTYVFALDLSLDGLVPF